MPPRASFLFKHALVQDIAYSMLLLGLRRSLHGRIARALEEQFPDAMQGRPETLAHHFTEAGLFEQAVEYWCRAGRQSVARSGFVEAITQLRTGCGSSQICRTQASASSKTSNYRSLLRAH
jgi:predicted ATPase